MSGPHDRLVRFTFDHPERAAAELRAALPDFVVSQVDWTSLQPERGSVVDPELRQVRMQAYCDGRGWFPVWYVETAKGTKNDRPEFLRAVTKAMAGLAEQPQAFLVWALDRFGRDQAFMLLQIQSLESAGVITASLAEKWLEEDDDNKPVMLGVTSGIAASELKRLRRRSKEGQDHARAKGKHIGRPFKNLALLQDAARLVVSGECSIRKAAAQVSRGLPKVPEQPGGLSRISAASLSRFLNGTWKGQGGPSQPAEYPQRCPEKARPSRSGDRP